MQKKKLLYQGKVKSLYATEDADYLIMEFGDDATAFNDPSKTKVYAGKGALNNQFNAFVMPLLAKAGIPVHFEKQLTETTSLVKHLNMLPLECIVRNRAAGTICKRLGLKEAEIFKQPVFEFCYKNDELGDPLINESHILALGLADAAAIDTMKKLAFKVNDVLSHLLSKADLLLVDFKLEFGYFHNTLLLGDEFTLDGCRVWDKNTGEKFDKDRFRQGLGNFLEHYQTAAKRIMQAQ